MQRKLYKKEERGLKGGPNYQVSEMTGSVTSTGYWPDSPDRNNDFNIIPSNEITMEGMDMDLMGIDDMGNMQYMTPGENYTFPGNYVTEIPVANQGGIYLGNYMAHGGTLKPLPKAKDGPPPANALEFWRQSQDKRKKEIMESGKKLKGLPGNPYSQKEADAIAKEQEALRQMAYYKQFSERPQAVESTLGPVEGAIALAAGAPALASTLGAELLGTGVTLGNLANTGFATHGVYNFANPESDFRQALSRYNQGEGDWRDVAFEGGLNALNFLGARSLPGDIKALSNVRAPQLYKYNPWAWKPNPKAYYHRTPNPANIINLENGTLQGFGQSAEGAAYNELAIPGKGPGYITPSGRESRINIRKAAHSENYFSKGVPLDFGRYNKGTQGYRGPYLAEVEGVPFVAKANGKFTKVLDPVTGQYTRGIYPPPFEGGYAVAKGPIPLTNTKFYKEHWLMGYKPINKAKGGSLPKAQDGNPLTEALVRGVKTAAEPTNNYIKGNIKRFPNNAQIDYAVSQLKEMDPNYNPDVETLMKMTAWMENDYGANPNAYNRNYTNSFMSIDKPALDDIYTPRGKTYNKSQQKIIDSLKKQGYTDRAALEKALRNDDPFAAMLTARSVYYMSPEALPDMNDPEAVFKYFGKNYNKYGYRKHMSDEEAYNKFLKGWEKYGKKSSTSKGKMAKGGMYLGAYKQVGGQLVPHDISVPNLSRQEGGAVKKVKIKSLPKNWKSQ